MFHECIYLETAVIPYTIKKHTESTFSWCSNLKSITFEENSQLETIGSDLLWYSSKLETINYSGTVEQWNNIPKGNSWNSGTSKLSEIQCSDGTVSLK